MIKAKRKTAFLLAVFVAAACLAFPASGLAKDQDPEIWIQSHKAAHQKAMSLGIGFTTKSSTSRAHVKGVDVSYHNKTIDWKSAKKKNNIKFAIVRCGYSGWTKGTKNTDTQFKNNVTNASAAGLKVGVYYYSQALSVSEATAEANYVVKLLKPYTAKINMPVALDYEYVGSKESRLDKAITSGTLTKSKATQIVNAFYSVIKKAGYTPMLYANGMVLNKISNVTSFKPLWYCSAYSDNCEFYQYKQDTSVSGFSGAVDMNYWYTTNINKYSVFNETTSISLSGASDSSVNLTWKAAPRATKYKVTRKNADNSSDTSSKTTTSTTLTDTGLSPNTTYTYTVTPYESSKAGKTSPAVSVTTASSDNSSSDEYYQKTAGLSQKKTSNGRKVSWAKTYGASKYIVRIYTNGTPVSQPASTTKASKTITTVGTSYVITGLKNGTARKVTVTPVNSSGTEGVTSKPKLTYPAFQFTTKSSSGTNMSYKYNGKYYNSSRTVVTTSVKTTAKAKTPVNIRAKASAYSKSKGVAKTGKTVTVTKCYCGDGSWTKIKYGKKSGYIKSKYLKKY